MKGKCGPVKARWGQVLLWLWLAVFLGSAVLVNPAAAFRFVFLGDSRTYGKELYNHEALKDLCTEVKKQHPDFVVFGGDMARWGGAKHLQDWLSFMRQSLGGIRLYPVKGNHEIHQGDKHKSILELDREYNQVFGLKRSNFTFTHPNAPLCFLVVDVDSTGVPFTGYTGRNGHYAPVRHP